MKNVNIHKKWFVEREAGLNKTFAPFRSAPPEHKISAMPVVIAYTAIVGRIEYFKRGEEPVFQLTRTVTKGSMDQCWEEVPENVYAIRDEFLRVKTPEEASGFLLKTGAFSPLTNTITWSEFRRWQRFAHLIQEHDMLAAAMNDAQWKGERGEVLKALTGYYSSSFFDDAESPQTHADAESYARLLRERPELRVNIQEGERLEERRRRDLWGWFRKPPSSIEWMPKSREAEQRIARKLQAGGAMIEFLLPREQLQPVLLIRPECSLQAIAAAIYAERIQGIEYRTCDWCGDLFKIGTHRTKRYCDFPRPCKGNAHKRRMRIAAKARKEAELAALKPGRDKAKRARKA